MSRKQLIWGFIAVAVLLGAADFYFLHILFPLKRAAMIERLNRAVKEHLENSHETHEAEASASFPQGPKNSETDALVFTSSLKKCFGDSATDPTPDALLVRLELSLTIREVDTENWHIRRPDGHEERVMLITEGSRREIRLFKVDAEGLPIPQKISSKIGVNPTAATIEAMKSPGEIIYHQTQERLKFRDGSSAAVDRIDGHLQDLQVFLRGKTLSCRKLDCQCDESDRLPSKESI